MTESILDTIIANVQRRLDWTPEAPGLERLALRMVERRGREGRRSLRKALAGTDPEVIAECKKASPSSGVIRDPFNPVKLATAYEAGRAAAISVVTEPDSFQGDPLWISRVREAVSLPVLRKDFIITRRQLFESAVLGADAVLLISRILPGKRLEALLTTAEMLELEVLLEIFIDEDPGRAIDSGAEIIGVNARDLATFEVDLDRVEAFASVLPDDRIKVAESGIHGPSRVAKLHAAGFNAFLVGEHLIRSDNPEHALRRLVGRQVRFG
jgi:indole-3-glycerol phosphate synthase